jgi:hypothetical protein
VKYSSQLPSPIAAYAAMTILSFKAFSLKTRTVFVIEFNNFCKYGKKERAQSRPH